jgi:hypothetical protein
VRSSHYLSAFLAHGWFPAMRHFSVISPPSRHTDDLIAVLALAFTLYLTLARRDAWPFTRYPMFSSYLDPAHVRVVCFALETRDGQLHWWHPRFYRYPDKLGRKAAGGDTAVKLWCVSEVIRLIRLEEGDTLHYRAIHVIERKWVHGDSQDLTIASVPLPACPRAH